MIKKNVVVWIIVTVIEYIAACAIGGWVGRKTGAFLSRKFPLFKEDDKS